MFLPDGCAVFVQVFARWATKVLLGTLHAPGVPRGGRSESSSVECGLPGFGCVKSTY